MGNGVIGRSVSKEKQDKKNIVDEIGGGTTVRPSLEVPDPIKTDKAQALVICGPSGAGKSTIYGRIMQDESVDTTFRLALQDTTRAPRPGEKDGVDYNFLKFDDFVRNESSRQYEWLGVLNRSDGSKYGFNKSELKHANIDGVSKHIVSIFDIDVERALRMRRSGLVDVALILMLPPNETTLTGRLKSRADHTMTDDKLHQRLEYSHEQMQQGFQNFGDWDLIMVNDDLEHTYVSFRKYCHHRFRVKEVRT